MRGDLKGLAKAIKKDARANKASAKIERSLKRRRKAEPPSNVDVAATRPTDFSTEYLHNTSSRDVNALRRALLESGLYYVAGVCEDRALLLAPRQRDCSQERAITIARRAFSKNASQLNGHYPPGHHVPVLNGAVALEPVLFDALCDSVTIEGSVSVSVCRRDVAGVPLLMLSNSPDNTYPHEPADIGLTYSEFGTVQREAARLLGLHLLTEWAM